MNLSANHPAVPVRNGAPRLDARGRALRVTPWLARLGDQAVPLNRAGQARLLWQVARAQAEDVQELGAQLRAEFSALDTALLGQQTALQVKWDDVHARLHAEQSSEADAAEVQRQREAVTAAETRWRQAQERLGAALAAAGLRGREEFELHADQVACLGSERGTFPQLPRLRVWGGAAMLASLLMGPALYELGLRAMWISLGFPEALDAAGVGLACVIGVAIAATLKGALEQLSFLAASRSAARQVRLSGQGNELDTFLRRHQWWGGLVLAVTFGVFAYIEGTLVSSSFMAGDVQARVSGGESHWLQVLSGLIALLPSSVLGMATGQLQARQLVAVSVAAQARHEARAALRARPDVRSALAASYQEVAAQEHLQRAETQLELCRAEALARRTQLREGLQAQLTQLQARLTDVQQRRRVLEADYGRRLEELHQRADQSAELALKAYAKQGWGSAWIRRVVRQDLPVGAS